MIFKEYEMFTYNEQAFASAVLKTADLILKDRIEELFSSPDLIKSMRSSIIRTLKHLILLENFDGYTPEQKGNLSGLFKIVDDRISSTLEGKNPQMLTLVLEVCKKVNKKRGYMVEKIVKLYVDFWNEKQKQPGSMEKTTIENVLLCFDAINNALYVHKFDCKPFLAATLSNFNKGFMSNPGPLVQRISGLVVPKNEPGARMPPQFPDEVIHEILLFFGRGVAHPSADFSAVHRRMVDFYASRLKLYHFPGKASNELVIRSWYFNKRDNRLQDRSNIFDFITDENNWKFIACANMIPLFTELLMTFIVCPGQLALSKGSTHLAHASSAPSQFSMEIVPEKVKPVSIINDANNFIRTSRSGSEAFKKDFIEALQEVIHDEDVPSQQMFESVLTNIWRSLTPSVQAEYVEKMKSMLFSDIFIEQRFNHVNSLNSLLMGLFKCEPKIVLPHEILRFLGKTYNGWHVVFQWMQRDYPDNKDVWINAARMYQELSEYDNYFSLMAKEIPETKEGFICEDFCQYIRAKENYITLRRERETMPESRVWEENYVECCKKLGQFEALRDYAFSTQNPALSLEMCIRLNDIAHMKEITRDGTNEEDFSINKAITQTLEQLGEKSEPVGRDVFDSFVAGIMKQWLILPASSDRARTKAYILIQQNLETKNIDNVMKNRTDKIVKNTSIQWRDRLPNPWEDIGMWNEFFCWREAALTSIFKVITVSYAISHETAWHIDKHSQIFRKHFMPESCLGTLQKIYKLPDIEIAVAYCKLKNQVKCQAEIGRPSVGLDVINGIDMKLFTQTQAADFFRLKGNLLNATGRQKEAYMTYKNAVELCPCLSSSWVSWGIFCMEQLENLLSGTPIFPESPIGEDPTQWALSAFASFITVNIKYKILFI